MFEEIITKEYQDSHTDCTDATVISQQGQAKDLEGKKLVLANLQELANSQESGQDNPKIPGM